MPQPTLTSYMLQDKDIQKELHRLRHFSYGKHLWDICIQWTGVLDLSDGLEYLHGVESLEWNTGGHNEKWYMILWNHAPVVV